MNVQDIEVSFGAMQWVLTTGIGVYTWIVGRQAASAKELTELRTSLTRLEAQVNTVPTTAELQILAGDLKGLRADLHGLREVLQTQARIVDRINMYLLDQKR